MKRILCFFSVLLMLFFCGCHASGVTVVEGQRESTAPITTLAMAQTETPEETTASAQTEEVTEKIVAATTASETPEEITEEETVEESEAQDYILNLSSKKFHYPTCGSVRQMKDTNRQQYHGTREELIAQGYDPCGNCHP